jgi:hypothetical protein
MQRQQARKKHQLQKRRFRYKRIFDSHPYSGQSEEGMRNFNALLTDLRKLNVKYLQILLSDLKSGGAIPPWYGDYHRMLVIEIEASIIERTLLK